MLQCKCGPVDVAMESCSGYGEFQLYLKLLLRFHTLLLLLLLLLLLFIVDNK